MATIDKETLLAKAITLANVCRAKLDERISWHLGRHTFASEICLSNGVPIETISRMLGHPDIKTTQIYARTSDTIIERDMRILVEKLNTAAASTRLP